MLPKRSPGPHKGYKQSPEHVALRIRYGEEHHAWKGDAVSKRGGRSRALREYPSSCCSACGLPRGERHHIDGNTANNEPLNVVIICRRCHMLQDGRLVQFRELAYTNQPKAKRMRWANRVDSAYRSGDKCPQCGHVLSVIQTNPGTGLIYVGCRYERGGCGFNAGSHRRIP